MVGEPISIRRGAIRGNPLPVSGPPLDSVISPGCVCSIDKLSRACCTRAGACAFQRGVRAAGARTRPHKANTFLVYFPTISPQSSPCNPRLFSLFRFSGGGTTTAQAGRLSTEGGEIGNYPFECGDYLAIFPPSLSTFWLLRLVCFCSRLSFARETRCGNKGWFFIVFSCQLSQVNRCFDSRGGFILCICYSYFL